MAGATEPSGGTASGPDAVAASFERFARRECTGYSRFYEELALRVAGEPRVVALCLERLPGQPAPNLLFAAVRDLLARGRGPRLAGHYARGGPADSVGSLLAKLAGAHPALADAVVRGLAEGWPAKEAPKLDARAEEALERLAGRLSGGGRSALVRLAGSWGSKRLEKYAAEVAKALLARVEDASLGAEERAEAMPR